MKKTYRAGAMRLSIPLLLLALAIAFGLWQWRSARAMELDLTAAREKAYFSALDGLNALETDLSKVLIAESPGQHALLLSRIASLAAGISENLAALPAAYGADADGLKFLTQTADYAQTLATAAAEGRLPSETDTEQLMALKTRSGELRAHLESGADFAYDAMPAAEKASGIEYPSLLYDGPFSDGLRRGTPRGLTGSAVTAEEAVAIATAFLGGERVQQAVRTSDTGGPMAAWGVSLNLGDVQVTAAVTQQGGKMLWITPEHAGFEAQLDMEECIVHAKAFLNSRGFSDMQDSYTQQYDGMAVISFAATQDGVMLYPDLVKVQVRMDTGAVIGLEANNYWMNHATRERLHPAITEEEAKLAVSSKLSISAAQLCVIPLSDGLGSGRTEALCWEFDGQWNGDRYLIYIDAETGEELQVLKVVLGGGGILTL
ncbi:MAG: germination protein YpeB [Oscillospiraceae bacterium]|nr:germination protein YpeB [Oscillospiraceae bacterium]